MPERAAPRPDWDRLYSIAAPQEGLFTTRQAAEAGYSSQLLPHYIHTGHVTRVRRGVYRLVHFPAGEHEPLVVAWLWSDQEGVASHSTALALYGLSDVLPARIHLTVPLEWRRHRYRTPDDLTLHHADLPPADRTWFQAVPITTVPRTLADCARDDLSPDLLRQAARQALHRGLVERHELAVVERALRPYGGLAG